jgi:hypothetical protein
MLSITTTPVSASSLRCLSSRPSANPGTAQAGANAVTTTISDRANAIATITTTKSFAGDERPSVESAAPRAAALWGCSEARSMRADDGPRGLARCLTAQWRTGFGRLAGADTAGAETAGGGLDCRGRDGGGDDGAGGGGGGGGGVAGCGSGGGGAGGGGVGCALVVGGGSGVGTVVEAWIAALDPLTNACVVAKPRTARPHAVNQRRLALSRNVERFRSTTPPKTSPQYEPSRQ